jgi:N-ethylmaleimide reductase
VEGWKPGTDAVHRAGGLFFLQLWHTGRISHPDLQPDHALPVSTSPVKPKGQAFTKDGMKDHVTPRALETAEIPGIVEDYRRAAECAARASFDGVEVHSANNYLLEQFLRDSTNHRTDEYGGSIENRIRFPLAAIQAAIDVWGADRVGVRISPGATNPGETPLDSEVMATYGAYIERRREMGTLYLHVIEGTAYSTVKSRPRLILSPCGSASAASTWPIMSTRSNWWKRLSKKTRPTCSASPGRFWPTPTWWSG